MDNLTGFTFPTVLILAFAIALLLLSLLRWLAPRIGLLDHPDERKLHSGSIPLVGGIAIYLAGFATVLLSGSESSLTLFFLLSTPLVLIGILDDRFGTSVLLRLGVQILVAIVAVFMADIGILTVGNIFGYGSTVLNPFFGYLFTVVCVVGVINSINMIDGADGLSGGVIMTTLLALLWLTIESGSGTYQNLVMILIGGLAAFLVFNLEFLGRSRRVFLGDSGSMFLGLALVWLFVKLSQGPGASLSPVAAGWLFGVPLIDTVSVMVARVRQGTSPLRAGRDHVHHKLLAAGFSSRHTLAVICCYQLGLVLVGLVISRYPMLEFPAFWVFVVLVMLHHFYLQSFGSSSGKSLKESAAK